MLGAHPRAIMGWRELVLWASVLLLANNLVAALTAPHDAALGWSWLAQSRFGGFDALAWGVALWRLAKAPERPAKTGEIALVLGLCLLGGLKQQYASPLALTGLGLWLLANDEGETRAAAAVFLAIASRQLWSHLVFAILSPEMVKIDAAMVGEAVTLAVKGATWRDNIITVPGGHAIAILEGCSSFANVSASLLAWVALAKLERVSWVRRDLWVAVAAVLAQVSLNVARMYLMAQSQPLYLYWHEGTGAQVYVAAASAMAVLIAVFGTRWAAGEA